MRWFTTFLLILLVALGVLWLVFGDTARRAVGVNTRAETPSVTAATLADQLKADTIRRIQRTLPNGETLTLERVQGEWSQPGQWPVRQAEANALAAALADLKSRFQPIPLDASADLKPYGLDPSQKPVVVRVDAAAKTLTLTFGQPPDAKDAGFGRPCYLRLDDQPEVLRLGPDAFAAMTHPTDAYRRRQIFPDAARVKLSGGESLNPMMPLPPSGRSLLPTDKLTAVKVEGPQGGFALRRVKPTPAAASDPDRPASEPTLSAERVAGVWELVEVREPDQSAFRALRDHVDPAKLRGVLTALPEIWAEQFVSGRSDAELGLDKPERSVQLSFVNGTNAVLRIGKLSRRVVREAAPPPPSPFGQPPPPPAPKIEEYYYARLDNNPLVFEIRGDKFNDMFAAVEEVRDANLARFDSDDVNELTIAVKGQPPIKLTKKKGNKDAEKEDERQDRWYLGDRLAERSKVRELLDALTRLEAKGKEERLDETDAKKLADWGFAPDATQVTVTTDNGPMTFVIGKQDPEKKKLYVQMAGWPRVNIIADDVWKLIDRNALAYRGRRLFDTAEVKLNSVAVAPASGEGFTLAQDAEKKWQLTAPITSPTDESKAASLTGDLSRLEVTEYVDDAPKAEDVEKKYGLAKPQMIVKLGFEGGKEQTLEIGTAQDLKPEVYARLAGTNSVFTLPKDKVDTLNAGAAGLLPLQLWAAASDKVTAIEVMRADGEKYKLSSEAGNWKLSGAFEAPVPYLIAQPLLSAATAVKAEKYEAVATADLAKYGLDKPAVKVSVNYKEQRGDKEELITKTVALGHALPDNPSMCYGMVEGTKSVFVLSDALAKEANKPALDRLDRTLYSLDSAAIQKVSIAGPDAERSTTLIREKVAWKAEGKPFAIDAFSVTALTNAVSRPMAARLAAYGSNLNFAEFGLDKPEYTITTTLADMKSHVVKLGKPAPDGGRYGRVDDGPAVAIFAEPVVSALTRKPLDFVDRSLFNFDVAQLAGIIRREGTDVLELAPGATAAGWDILKPEKHKGDQSTLDELADQLAHLRAASVAAYEPADLEEYGLRFPYATVILKIGLDKPEEKTLRIGNETDDGKSGDRYATVDGKTIGVLPHALVKKLLADPLKFRDRTLAKFVDADQATLVRGERTVTFAKVDGTWKLMKPITTDAEQAELDELINAVAKLRADELAVEQPESLAPYGLDRPELTWTFLSGDKEVLKLALGRHDPSGARAYAQVQGSPIVALLDPTMTARLEAEYRKRAVWSGVDAAQIETIAVSSGMSGFSLRKQGTTWIDPERPEDKINSSAVTEFLDSLAGLKAVRYAADDKADFKLYGLDPGERVITLLQKGGVTKVLHIGREVGDQKGRVYARVGDKDRSDVFVVGEADATKIRKERSSFLAK